MLSAREPDLLDPLVVHSTPLSSRGLATSPSSVDTITRDTAELLDLLTFRQAAGYLPNVGITQAESARATSYSVRGSHEISLHELTGGRAGIGYYLDDIPFSDAFGRDLTMFSIERMSFFKGPHGTAFGVPHSMGVFRAGTIAPGPEPWGEVESGFGSHGFLQVRTHFSGPLAPGLFASLDGLHSRDDGWFEEPSSGSDYGARDATGGRVRLRWMPTADLTIELFAGASRHRDDAPLYVHGAKPGDIHDIGSIPNGRADGGQNHQSIQVTWKKEDWQLKSITSRAEAGLDDRDEDFLLEVFRPMSFFRERKRDIRNVTQEFRAESTDLDAPLRWRAGTFYGWRDSELDQFFLGNGPWEGRTRIRYRQDDLALHGEATQDLGERLSLSAGLRLQTTADRSTSAFDPTDFATSIGGSPQTSRREADFDAILPMVAGEWQWSRDHRTYLRYSEGYQPGGLAITGAGSVDYEPERSHSLELGHEWSGECSVLRTVAFFTDYRDYQSFQFNPAGTTIFNADSAEAWGAEIEFHTSPLECLELVASAGFTRARYGDFVTPVGDFSGNTVDGIPASTLHLGAIWRAHWGGVARIDWRHVGETWFDAGNTARQQAYPLFDASLGYERENFSIHLVGRNLFDEDYFSNIYLFFGTPTAVPAAPRFLGLEMQVSF